MNDLARRLLTSQTKGQQDSTELANATERACQRLRHHFARLLGHDGSYALLSRSLKLAQSRFSLSRPIKGGSDTHCLDGLTELIQDHEPAATFELCVGILDSIIALLASFVGEDLAKKLVEEAFVNPGDAEPQMRGGG